MVQVAIDDVDDDAYDDDFEDDDGTASERTASRPQMSPELAPFVVSATDGEKMYALLDEAVRLLDVCGVEHWLTAGTLLGSIRHGGIIPWDDDVRARRVRRRSRRRGPRAF